MKAKKIAKRLRARAYELHDQAGVLLTGESAQTDRARLIADVLDEIADQLAPRQKTTKAAKSAKVAVKGKAGTTMGWKAAE